MDSVHRNASPSPEGLDRLAAAIGEGFRVAAVARFGGGVAAATHGLTLRGPGGSEQQLILKRYPIGDETPRLEWERLGCAARVALPTPQRVAVDPDGAWFGTPALLMSALSGQVEMRPRNVDAWTRELARALAAIHRTDLGDAIPPVLRRPHLWTRWQLWNVEVDARIASATAAIQRLQREASREPEVLCHDDFHPGNVLFEDGSVSGVVDWSGARLAPAAADVAYCRADLAIAPGADAPIQFLAHYQAASGEQLERLALWDVLAGMHALQWSPGWLESYADAGVRRRADEVRAAVERFLDDALTRC